MSVTIPDIIRATAAEFRLTMNELLSDSRDAKVSHPRAIAVSLAKELTKASHPVIAAAFNIGHRKRVALILERQHVLIDAFPEMLGRRQAILARLGLQ